MELCWMRWSILGSMLNIRRYDIHQHCTLHHQCSPSGQMAADNWAQLSSALGADTVRKRYNELKIQPAFHLILFKRFI